MSYLLLVAPLLHTTSGPSLVSFASFSIRLNFNSGRFFCSITRTHHLSVYQMSLCPSKDVFAAAKEIHIIFPRSTASFEISRSLAAQNLYFGEKNPVLSFEIKRTHLIVLLCVRCCKKSCKPVLRISISIARFPLIKTLHVVL